MSATTPSGKNWLAELTPVASAFSLHGRLVSIAPYGSGHINDTYVLVCQSGDTRTRYVLQRINLFLRRRSQRAYRVMRFPEARRLGLPRLQGTIRYPGGAHARTG